MATAAPIAVAASRSRAGVLAGTAVMTALLALAPFVGIYPVFMMKALCFAIFACAFNLLLGFTGLLSFGHAAFMGSIVTGFALGLIEGLTKVFYPPAANTVVFALMALVLLIRPAGLFGRAT